MSQYGYIPIENADLLQETYNIATPATWRFEKNEIVYGGVEDWEFTEAQKTEIITLGGQWYWDAKQFLEWIND